VDCQKDKGCGNTLAGKNAEAKEDKVVSAQLMERIK
jgi:hypothetical protein